LGNQEWVRIYDAFGEDDNAYSVKQTSDSGFVLAGVASTPPNLMNNVRLMKTDKNGNKLVGQELWWVRLPSGVRICK